MYTIANVIRREFLKSDSLRDAGLQTPPSVQRFDNLPYGEDVTWQILDLYRPKSAVGSLPVIVNVHGGGWVYGTKETYQYYCMSLAQRGFAVLNFSYRLAPEYRFPAPLEDLNLVIGWLGTHAGRYGLDLNRVYAVGDSAGAHTLAQYACICTNDQYAKAFPFAVPQGFSFTAVALNCGSYSVQELPQSMFPQLLDCYLPGHDPEHERELMQVPNYVTSAFPPSFIMTSNGDFLKDQAEPFAKLLQKRGIRCVLRTYGDEKHLLGHVFHCDIRQEASAICNDEECAFFLDN